MSSSPADARAAVVEHLRRSFIHELGVDQVEVWRGKDGLFHHSVVELAEIVATALEPLLADHGVEAQVLELHADGKLAPSPLPLDPHDW